MCSKEVKENPNCLVCSGKVGFTARNSVQIFSNETHTCSERPLSFVMTQILGINVQEDLVHSLLICKKCFKLFNEVDELEQKLLQIKLALINNYKKSVEIHKNKEYSIIEEVSEVHNVNNIKTSKIFEQSEICEMPKKILDIPSSDEEGEQNTSRKANIRSLEDIEMELVKIHGETISKDNNSDDTKELELLEDSNQPFHGFEHDIGDSNMEENQSDSDYDANESESAEVLLQAVEIADDDLSTVEIQMEVSNGNNDKSNILKGRTVPKNIDKKITAKKVKDDNLPPIVTRDGNMYTCLLCEGDETVCGEAKAIMQHAKQVHEARVYICDVCGEDFRKRNELSSHLDEHVATEEGDFQCEVCNRIFSNLRLFRIHKRMHYPQNKAWTCENCGKRYSSKNLLEEHINTHTGTRPYVCQLCGKDFASKYTFKAHEKTHEVRPRPFQCSQCSKSFLSQQNLTQHERTHSGVKEFQCHLCDKQFGSVHNLEVHSIVHTGYKPYECGRCGKAFARKAEIRDHERTHTGERPYQCEFCGATFSQRSNLQSHKRATHYDDKRYKCEHCAKGFKRRRLLDYHIKAVHTGERPFKCDVCEATFVYPEHFKKHRRIHTGEKPYICEVCGKAFNSRDNRNAHRFVHSDKKPYECLICGAGFMRKPLLYQHMTAQGHLNETIVVNQPRLTTDDDQILTVNADGEMELVEDTVRRLEPLEGIDDESKVYITDLKPHMLVDGKVFEHADGNIIVTSEQLDEEQLEESSEAVEHIIIDGDQIQFAEDGEDEDADEIEGTDTGTHIITSADDYERLITSAALANGESQILQTNGGPVQFLQVRIPNSKGGEEDAWLKIGP